MKRNIKWYAMIYAMSWSAFIFDIYFFCQSGVQHLRTALYLALECMFFYKTHVYTEHEAEIGKKFQCTVKKHMQAEFQIIA